MSNWDMCFYCKIKVCSLEDCPNRDRGRLQRTTAKPNPPAKNIRQPNAPDTACIQPDNGLTAVRKA